MQKLVASRWLPLADLAAVSTSIIVLEIQPELGWLPLLIALIPRGLRVAAGKPPFVRTPFDLLIILFLLTALMGVWAAYDRQTAWLKFWLLVAAALMFYAYAGQPRINLWPLAGYLSFIGFALALFFFFLHDWSAQPAKIGFLNHIALAWMKIRPPLGTSSMHPNDAGGIMAMMAPFGLAWVWRAWEQKKKPLFTLMLLSTGLVLLGILLTTSRGAWMAAGAALAVWLLWVLTCYAQARIPWRREVIYAAALSGIAILGLGLVLSFPEKIVDLVGTVPGPNSALSRLDLAHAALDLIDDFPFTGGGLQSFPGLYSQYILVVPNFITSISHNMFLDIALEQSVLGLLAYAGILIGCVWLLVRADLYPSEYPLRWAVVAATIVMAVHGLVDDIVYNVWGAPELFLLSGLAVGISQSGLQTDTVTSLSDLNWKKMGTFAGVSIFCALGIAYTFRSHIVASWYADLGAVQMAHVELAAFPTNSWDDGHNLTKLAPAEQYFDKALEHNPDNRTAHHRLGLIALLRRDFPNAISQLNAAYQVDSSHRGIIKSLGYSYAWTGQFDQAATLLQTIPEARNEMDTYTWWWGTQGRDDLSSNASQMVQILNSGSFSSSGTIQKP